MVFGMKKIGKKVLSLVLSLTLCAVFIISSAFTALSAGESEENLTTVRGTLTINGLTQEEIEAFDPDN
jgi:hypothetical protein